MYPKVTPPFSILPAEGFKSPAASDNKVVFPQPDGPTTARNSPCFTENERSFTATVSPFFVW